MSQCSANTKDGNLCQIPAPEGKKYCHIHRKQKMWRFIVSSVTSTGLVLFALGLLADVTGVLGYFGLNLPSPTPTSKPNNITFTNTPIRPETISSTSSPAIHKLNGDDFSDSSSGWDTSQYYCWANYDYNTLKLGISDQWFCFIGWTAIGKKDNIALQVDVLGPFGENLKSFYGLGFGAQNKYGRNGYAFGVDSSGTCQFFEHIDNSEYGGWQRRITETLPKFNKEQTYHTVTINIKYSEARGYVDGKYCTTYIMPNYKNGFVGVVATAAYVSSDYAGGEARFDEYVIGSP